jgi:hypothetical protein
MSGIWPRRVVLSQHGLGKISGNTSVTLYFEDNVLHTPYVASN